MILPSSSRRPSAAPRRSVTGSAGMPDATPTPAQSTSPVRTAHRDRLHARLTTYLEDYIRTEGLRPGDRLPSERRLADDLGVSRATLSRALAALEGREVVEVRHGVGAVIRERSPDPRDGSWGDLLATASESDVAALRETVFAGLARAAATNPDASARAVEALAETGQRTFAQVRRSLLDLSDFELLNKLEILLATRCRPPSERPSLSGRLDGLMNAVLAGQPDAAAMACQGLWMDGKEHRLGQTAPPLRRHRDRRP